MVDSRSEELNKRLREDKTKLPYRHVMDVYDMDKEQALKFMSIAGVGKYAKKFK